MEARVKKQKSKAGASIARVVMQDHQLTGSSVPAAEPDEMGAAARTSTIQAPEADVESCKDCWACGMKLRVPTDELGTPASEFRVSFAPQL